MYFAAKDEGKPEKKMKEEEPPKEQKDMYERLSASWPTGITDVKEGDIHSTRLRNLLFQDETPHVCGTETYYVNARLGSSRRLGVFASFKLVAVVSDTNPPQSNENLVMAVALNWGIMDHKEKKYYRFSYLDHRSPIIIPNLIAKRQLRGETHVMQAIMEQVIQDDLILPDQLLEEPSDIYIHELNMKIGETTFQQINTVDDNGVRQTPVYKLHLSGVTHEFADNDLAKEFNAVVDIEFQPRVIPMLDGDRGVISNGLWEDDKFGFITPNCIVKDASLRITRASDHLEIVRELNITKGSVWMDHSFGGVIPRSPEEASFLHQLRKRREADKVDTEELQFKAMIRLFDEEQSCISVTEFLDGNEAPTRVYSVVQKGKEKRGYSYQGLENITFSAVPTSQYRSPETAILYATEWCVRTPLYDHKKVDLKITASFQRQEFTTVLAFPSYWEGIAEVIGTVINEDGSSSEVMGEAFVSCRGKGKHTDTANTDELYHNAVIGELIKPEVALFKSPEEIANGPGARAVATIGLLKKMQQVPFSDVHKVIYGALFGTIAYIHHHHDNLSNVRTSLEWCYKMWLKYYGNDPIDCPTLYLRSFMLRELGLVMNEKCKSLTKRAVALDVAVPRLARDKMVAARQVLEYKTLPQPDVTSKPAADLDLAVLRTTLEGTWTIDSDETQGNLVEVLREQNVGVMWRYLLSRQEPTYRFSVEATSVVLYSRTLLDHEKFVFPVNGKERRWRCSGRGDVVTKAAVLEGGKTLFVETQVDTGVERTWYFGDEKGCLMEHISFFPTGSSNPSATCVNVFRRSEEDS